METIKKNISLKSKSILKIASMLLLVFMCLSCEDFFISEVTNHDIPGSDPQLVVYAYISPADSLVSVYVDRSKPYVISAKDYEPVNGNAYVYIAEKGSEFVSLQYNEERKRFIIPVSQFPVHHGKTYQLRVEAFDGEKVTGECSIPEFEIQNIEIDEPVYATDEWGGYNLIVDWRITAANNGQNNFYKTGAYMKRWEVHYYGNEPDTFYIGATSMYLDQGKEMFEDDKGNNHAFRASYYGGDVDWQNEDNSNNPDEFWMERYDSVFVYVIQSDVHYYRFHKSVEDYFFYDDDFPLAESIIIYTNIDGGLGAFGGYSIRNYLVPEP